MDERPRSRDLPATTRVTPAMRGRALPLPPLVPLLGVLCILGGFVLGVALAPKGDPLPPSSPAAIIVASPSFLDAPSDTLAPTAAPEPTATALAGPVAASPSVEIPPADGLSLAQALGAMRAAGMGASLSAVVSARVVRLAELSHAPSSSASGDGWVWLIVVGGTFPLSCGPRPLSTPAPCPWTTTERIVIDYHTGALLEP